MVKGYFLYVRQEKGNVFKVVKAIEKEEATYTFLVPHNLLNNSGGEQQITCVFSVSHQEIILFYSPPQLCIAIRDGELFKNENGRKKVTIFVRKFIGVFLEK